MKVLRPHIAVYRLFDLADEIALERLSSPRLRLSRPRSGAVHFENPPTQLDLGLRTLEGYSGPLVARLYDFGVAALSWRVFLGEEVEWDALVEQALRLPEHPALDGFFLAELEGLERYIAPALLRPQEERIGEEFTVIHLLGVHPARPAGELVEALDLAPVVLGEREVFAPEVRKELLRYTFSYSEEDLAVLGFDRVLIVDSEGIWDVAELVEFAHAELVELSYYDRVLARELEAVPEVLRQRGWRHFARFDRLRRRLMARHAEIADVRARMDSALRVTEDLYYAKIYRAALELYGAHEIERAVAEKLEVLSETYSMLTEEIHNIRSQVLEVGILTLILIEVIRAFVAD